MRSVVTGGAGFIGSHLVDELLRRGDEVAILDDLSTGKRQNLAGALQRGATLVVADITEPSTTISLAELAPDRVFHLAAQADVRQAIRNPVRDATVNVAGTAGVMEAARRAGARVVFASTGGAIYGEGAGRPLPLSEGAQCFPDSPYGQSKLAAEGYVAYYRRVHDLPSLALRLGNVYGPRQDPLGEAGVIAIFCGALASGGVPIVYGDGRQTRDYVYVADAVEALLAADALLAAVGPEALGPYNVGTGRETTVLELIEGLSRIGGRGDFVPRMEPARPGEVQRIALECGRADAELGWRSGTPLGDGLEITLNAVRGEGKLGRGSA